jgi:hypothetical protein
MNKKSSSSFANLAFPGVIGIVGLGLMIYSLLGGGPWIGLGFVLVATAFVTGVSGYGAARSLMEIPRSVDQPIVASKVA